MAFTSTTTVTPSLSFRLRTTKADGQGMLYCRLRFNKQLTTEYKIGVTVPLECWPKLPEAHPQSAGIKLQLAQVRADHQWIALNQPSPTAESIKAAWIEGVQARVAPLPESPWVTEAYADFLKHLTTPPKNKQRVGSWRPPASRTMENRCVVGRRLQEFLQLIKAPRLRIHEIKSAHGHQFLEYLFDRGVSSTCASRYLAYWSDSIDYATRYTDVVNPLISVKVKGEPPKIIHHLTPAEVIKLSMLQLSPVQDAVRKWALLMAYTGLDYRDAVKVAGNMDRYYQPGEFGGTIAYQRLKYAHAPKWGMCIIPVLPMTRELLAEAPRWKPLHLKTINRNLKHIGKLIGLTFPLHSKLFRKTAALIMFLEFGDIYVVQKVLGHSGIALLSRTYLNTPEDIVYKAMASRYGNDQQQMA